jgi:hypothetical protein
MNPVYPVTYLTTSFGLDSAVASGYYIYFTCMPTTGKKFRLLNATGKKIIVESLIILQIN